MFLMKPKFTIYKSSFYTYTICQIYTVNIAKELHASGGAILAHIWAKNAFHHFVLIGLLEQYTKFKSKTFKLTFIFAMVTKNGHQNGLKNGKTNIWNKFETFDREINVNSNKIFYQVIKSIRTHNILKAF